MNFRVHHVAISVHDIEESKRFYGAFGFRSIMEWADPSGSPRISHLQLEGTILELFWFADSRSAPESAAELASDLPRVGAKHFALQVDSIEQARQFVVQNGFDDHPQIVAGKTGVTYFFIKDPSGILLELVEDKRPAR